MTMALLEVADLFAGYGVENVLRGVSFTVEQGGITAILGANGAGKTTLLRTISGMLGPDFIVESSVGHIRDLPRGADEVPEVYKGESWARLGVDVDNGFKPLYVVSSPKKSVVANLKKLEYAAALRQVVRSTAALFLSRQTLTLLCASVDRV